MRSNLQGGNRVAARLEMSRRGDRNRQGVLLYLAGTVAADLASGYHFIRPGEKCSGLKFNFTGR
jgi:hypothetical protein